MSYPLFLLNKAPLKLPDTFPETVPLEVALLTFFTIYMFGLLFLWAKILNANDERVINDQVD